MQAENGLANFAGLGRAFVFGHVSVLNSPSCCPKNQLTHSLAERSRTYSFDYGITRSQHGCLSCRFFTSARHEQMIYLLTDTCILGLMALADSTISSVNLSYILLEIDFQNVE